MDNLVMYLACAGLFGLICATLFMRRMWEKTDTCHYCGNDAQTTDRVVPVSQGGTHSVPSCIDCNYAKNNSLV